MFDYRNTPFQKRFGNTGLADGAFREEAPADWPMIGESRFKLFTGKAPHATAIAYGHFCRQGGERVTPLDWFGPEIGFKLAGTTFRAGPGRTRQLPDFNAPHDRFIVSGKVLDVFLSLDPEAILHSEIAFQFENGEPHPTPLHFVTVQRIIDFIDLDRTYFLLVGAGEGAVSAQDRGPIGVRRDIPANVHLCRDSSFPNIVAASDEFLAALTRANIKGWHAKDPADHYRLTDYLRKQPKH